MIVSRSYFSFSEESETFLVLHVCTCTSVLGKRFRKSLASKFFAQGWTEIHAWYHEGGCVPIHGFGALRNDGTSREYRSETLVRSALQIAHRYPRKKSCSFSNERPLVERNCSHHAKSFVIPRGLSGAKGRVPSASFRYPGTLRAFN